MVVSHLGVSTSGHLPQDEEMWRVANPRTPLSAGKRWISTNSIREKFTDFYVRNGYRALPSASVVPRQDPSLLFTSAGMVPFKDRILNPDHRYGVLPF